MANDVTSKVILGIDPSEFRRGIQQVDAKLKQTSRLFGNLGQAIGAAFAVSKIQAFTAEAIELGSQMQTVSQAFSRFGNEANLVKLREATRGLVTDLDLMKQSVKAGNFGIPIQDMATLLEFATRRAAETGESVDYLVESIVNGIGKKSTVVLDNLGISAVRLKNEFNGAALEAYSIGEISQAVSKIATEELGKMGDAIDTATDKMARLSASWTNFKTNVGEAISPISGWIMDGIANMLDGLSTMGEGLNRLGLATGTANPSDLINKTKPAGQAMVAQRELSAGPFVPSKQEKLKLLGELNRVSNGIVYQDQVLRTALIPAYDEFNRMIKGAREQLELEATELQLLTAIGAQFGAVFTGAFQAALNNGTSFFDEIKNALKAYIQQMIIAVGVTAALAAVMTALRPGLSFGKAFQKIAGGTGLGSIFGEGGIVELFTTIKGFDLNATTKRVNGVLNLTR